MTKKRWRGTNQSRRIRDLTWKALPRRKGTGASQQIFTISSAVTNTGDLQWSSYPKRRLTRGMYKVETLTGYTIHTTGIRFAPSEVGLYTCTTEFDHNSTGLWAGLRPGPTWISNQVNRDGLLAPGRVGPGPCFARRPEGPTIYNPRMCLQKLGTIASIWIQVLTL